MKMAFIETLLGFLFTAASIYAKDIELLECDPPDIPTWGGYGPRQDFYMPGDIIHYFCDTDRYIGGNYIRTCEDNGDWSGNTPVCDPPATFTSVEQSSTQDEDSGPEKATDGKRNTCTATKAEDKQEWTGYFNGTGELIRVMLFLERGPAAFEVVLLKPNGEEMVCTSQTTNIDKYGWTFHNCPGPNNRGASGLKIRSLNSTPLKICELVAHVLTSPTCVDPHLRIENGRIRLNRKTASLICDTGFLRPPNSVLQCVRDGVWNRKPMYCIDPELGLEK